MSGSKSPTVESKYKRRARTKLARRVEGYNESMKRTKHPEGIHKPGSQNVRNGG